jgi:uncharacterized protein (DUF362 family)
MRRRHTLTRRTFIKLTATMAAGAALASCTPKQGTPTPTEVPPTTVPPTLPPSPTAGVSGTVTSVVAPPLPPAIPNETATFTPEPKPTSAPVYLAVAHGADPASITYAAVNALGGMKSFVKVGGDVIIKPNICVDYHPPEYAATTNPTVVAALVTMCLDAGAKRVQVMDYPFGGTPASAYEISGIKAAVEAAGGEMVIMTYAKYEKFDIPLGKSMTSTFIYRDILETDLLINVPIAKNHSAAILTLGAKNLMGIVRDRNLMHADLNQRIADLTSLVMPDLTVIDAVRILTDHGPTGGDLADVKQMDTVIASRDIVAADAYATTLFGMTAGDIGYIWKSAAMGLGTMDLDAINIQEINL